jgi:hypothetical protein
MQRTQVCGQANRSAANKEEQGARGVGRQAGEKAKQGDKDIASRQGDSASRQYIKRCTSLSDVLAAPRLYGVDGSHFGFRGTRVLIKSSELLG